MPRGDAISTLSHTVTCLVRLMPSAAPGPALRVGSIRLHLPPFTDLPDAVDRAAICSERMHDAVLVRSKTLCVSMFTRKKEERKGKERKVGRR